jgi:ABC-type transport system substrate-binding protein
MRIKQHSVAWLAVLIFFAGMLTWGCEDKGAKDGSTAKGAAGALQHGGTYRLPLTQNPASLDPARVHHTYDLAVVYQLFDGLIRFDPYLSPRPSLAETWRIEENGKRYTFILRNDARFHSGDAVTVGDVIFSLSRLLRVEPPPAVLPHLLKIQGAQAFRERQAEVVTGLQALGENILQVRLKEPHVPFLTALGMYHAMIVPQRVVTADAEGFGRQPVGSGPFRFVSWVPDQSIRLERFDRYYDGPSPLDTVLFKIYSKQRHHHVVEDFLAGDLEEMPVFSDEIKAALAGRTGLQWFHRPSLSLFFYGINNRKPPLSDPALRRVLSGAIDRRQLVETVYNGRFETAQTILPPGMPGYQPPNTDSGTAMPGSNLDQARQTKGMDGTPVIEIASAYDSPRVRAEMELVRASWEKLGIGLAVNYIPDWQAFNAYIRSDAVQVYRYVWFADMPDPDSILYPLFSSGSADNFLRFEDARVDGLLNAARGVVDPLDRARIYRQAEALIMASTPVIPLFHLSVDQVYQGNVRNVQPSALGAHTMSLHKVWLDRP